MGTETADLAAELRDAEELSSIGRDRTALAMLRRLAAEHPSDATVRCHLALALMRKGDTRAALREASAAVELGGEPVLSRHLRGSALLRLGRAAEARDALRAAADAAPAPGDAGVLGELAAAECACGDAASALEHAGAAVSVAPRSAAAHNSRALCLLAVQRWQDAEMSARRALEIEGGNVRAANNLALALAGEGGRLDEARAHLRTARVHSEVMGRHNHDVVVRNQRLLGAGDDHRGGLRTAATTMQLRGVVFVILIPIYALVRSPWIIPVLIVIAALLLRLVVFRGFGGGRVRAARLVALPATAGVTVAPPKRR